MKRSLLALLFTIFSFSFAYAACPAGMYFTTNDSNCIFVSPTNPLPMGMGFTQTARAPDLTATNTTGSVALGASAYVARVCNTSSTVNAYVALGDSSVSVTTANGILVPAGQCTNLNIGTATYLAGITSSSTALLQTSIGSGLASLGGGGSGGGSGTVTSVSVTTQNGVSASVTNPTTTPALAFTLGAITPSSVAIGAGSAITSSGPGGVLTALGYTVPGTGVATALGINVGSAGAPVLFNGAGGTPSSMTATNLSGTAASLTAGNVTTNANLTGVITSTGNATSIASQTGTGSKFVVDTSPLLVTPNIGVATAASINGNIITTGTGTLTLGASKTATISNTLTFTGTDGSTLNIGAGGTLAAVATSGSASDLTTGTLAAAQMGNAALVRAKLLGANLNTTADQPITITLPTGSTNFRFFVTGNITVSNPSISMTTAVCGVWTGAGKTGVTVVGSSAVGVAMSGLTSTSANTSGSAINVTVNNQANTYYNLTGNSPANTLYFACSTAQGAPATADVTVAAMVLN